MPRTKKAGRAINGTGSIRKTTKKYNGKEYSFWQGRYTDPTTGLQRSITAQTQKEVAQKLIETLNDINQGCYVAPSKLTLGEWLDLWLETYVAHSVKPYTKDAYQSACRVHIKPALGKIKLSALSAVQIQRFYNQLLENIPVYLYPQEYAAENGELDKYRLSRKLNLACKEAIEQAIGAHYSENRLDTSVAVKQVADAFGYERTLYVLAITVQHKGHDGRISDANKDWAMSVPIFEDRIDGSADNNRFLVVDKVNPGLVDLFVRGTRRAQAQEKEQQAERAKSKTAEKPSILEKLKRPLQQNSPNNSANFLEPDR